MHRFSSLFVAFSLFMAGVIAQETSLSPVVHRFKRHCGSYGCGRSVCQECPSCCGNEGPQPFNPVFNIQFVRFSLVSIDIIFFLQNCCGAPRPSPACCPYVPPAPLPPPPPSSPCCGPSPVPAPSPCCPPPPAPAAPCCPPPPPPSPIVCCKQAPVPENPCCQAVAAVIPPTASSPACCVAAPVPANPCCQPAPKPMPCQCSAPRPVPCRCGAPPISIDCPNCDMPAPRCSMMSPMECSMRRMRRDVHQQILQHFHRVQ
ncbi:hypothetical protein CRE_15407 [Caenorhabditis remanei]|uniref:Uncharacterized protein n=1 Tax=Caenorhabditis remanei TaxID=31234 RepID=E3MC77_CAERE|nr:hypothetical protein CRE_15407 [Caenorhabditis remanei]